jgi:hypothetical protein
LKREDREDSLQQVVWAKKNLPPLHRRENNAHLLYGIFNQLYVIQQN